MKPMESLRSKAERRQESYVAGPPGQRAQSVPLTQPRHANRWAPETGPSRHDRQDKSPHASAYRFDSVAPTNSTSVPTGDTSVGAVEVAVEVAVAVAPGASECKVPPMSEVKVASLPERVGVSTGDYDDAATRSPRQKQNVGVPGNQHHTGHGGCRAPKPAQEPAPVSTVWQERKRINDAEYSKKMQAELAERLRREAEYQKVVAATEQKKAETLRAKEARALADQKDLDTRREQAQMRDKDRLVVLAALQRATRVEVLKNRSRKKRFSISSTRDMCKRMMIVPLAQFEKSVEEWRKEAEQWCWDLRMHTKFSRILEHQPNQHARLLELHRDVRARYQRAVVRHPHLENKSDVSSLSSRPHDGEHKEKVASRGIKGSSPSPDQGDFKHYAKAKDVSHNVGAQADDAEGDDITERNDDTELESEKEKSMEELRERIAQEKRAEQVEKEALWHLSSDLSQPFVEEMKRWLNAIEKEPHVPYNSSGPNEYVTHYDLQDRLNDNCVDVSPEKVKALRDTAARGRAKVQELGNTLMHMAAVTFRDEKSDSRDLAEWKPSVPLRSCKTLAKIGFCGSQYCGSCTTPDVLYCTMAFVDDETYDKVGGLATVMACMEREESADYVEIRLEAYNYSDYSVYWRVPVDASPQSRGRGCGFGRGASRSAGRARGAPQCAS